MKCQFFEMYIIIVCGKQHQQSAKKKEAVIDLYYNQGKDNT